MVARPRLSPRLAAATLLLVALPAPCSETTHVVAAGESASSIARHYYGDFELTGLLLAFNGRHDAVLHPGETLRIPRNEVYRVRPGDSWSAIAASHLGRPSAWPAIAVLNGLRADAVLQPGQQLLVPVMLELDLRSGETLAILATRFYGEAELAAMLAEFNGIEDPRRIAVGQRISIPLTAFRAGSVEPEDAPVAPEPPDDPAFAQALRSVRRAWREGDYDGVLQLLEGLDVGDAGPDQRLDYWRWLAFVMVAFDTPDRACTAWSHLGQERGATDLDPDLVSPKIREALAACPS